MTDDFVVPKGWRRVTASEASLLRRSSIRFTQHGEPFAYYVREDED